MAQIYKTAMQDAERFRLEKAIADRDAEIKKQADYIASCKRDGAYWWREASGLGTKNVNLQAQLAKRDAEIERLMDRVEAPQLEHNKAMQHVQHQSEQLQAHEKREAAYLAFVEAYDLEPCVVDNEGFELDALVKAREQLRRVIDGMD